MKAPTRSQCLAAKNDRKLSDLGNAERFLTRHGQNVLFCQKWNKWLVWDGCRWALDEMGQIRRMAQETARSIQHEVDVERDRVKRAALANWAIRSESTHAISALIAEAQPLCVVSPSELDQHPWLLNCRNGTLDLRTGTLRDHAREDRLTKLCPHPYDPHTSSPLWESTLELFFHREDPDDTRDMLNFVQRALGLSLADVVLEQKLLVAYGSGTNGKSTILEAAKSALGPDYAQGAPRGLCVARRGESHPTELASLFGVRLVTAIETGEGQLFDEALVKMLTGGDTITARRMREDFWTFQPSHTLWMATNHKPRVKGVEQGDCTISHYPSSTFSR